MEFPAATAAYALDRAMIVISCTCGLRVGARGVRRGRVWGEDCRAVCACSLRVGARSVQGRSLKWTFVISCACGLRVGALSVERGGAYGGPVSGDRGVRGCG